MGKRRLGIGCFPNCDRPIVSSKVSMRLNCPPINTTENQWLIKGWPRRLGINPVITNTASSWDKEGIVITGAWCRPNAVTLRSLSHCTVGCSSHKYCRGVQRSSARRDASRSRFTNSLSAQSLRGSWGLGWISLGSLW